MKIMFFNLLSTCVSASLCCLTIYCAVKAREHNTPPDANESVKNGYSSDACAVSAIWLIFMIWFVVSSIRPRQSLYDEIFGYLSKVMLGYILIPEQGR